MRLRFNQLLAILIFISFVCFPQKKFLFDNLHAETAGNADWVIDEDNLVPGRYPTPAQSTVTSSTAESYWTGALSSWGIDLAKLGHTVETLTGSATLTYGNAGNPQDLKNYDVFVIDEPNTQFTATEKTALINFVQNGGGLFMISDHNGSDRNSNGWDSPKIWNDLFTNNGGVSNPFGMSIDLVDISQTSTNVLTGDYLTAGSYGNVTSMKWSDGATATLNPTANSSVTGIVWTTGTAHGNTGLMVARAKYGSGRVVLVCDSSPADDGTGGSGNTLYVGWLDPDVNGSHANLHMNASLWLAKILEPTSSSVLTVAPTALSGFSYYFGSGPSTSQSYSLSGSGLTGFPDNITVTAPANFEVSLDNSTFAASKLVSFTSATLSSTTIYVRLKSGLTVTTYSGDVTNAGGGATTQNVTCSGVVNSVPSPTLSVSTGTLSGFSYITGAGPSANQTYTVTGTNLSPSSGSITTQCLTDYEVSTNGSTFFPSVSLSYTGGALSTTTIYVRLKAGLSIGNYNSETVSNAGGSATTQNVTCSGVVNSVPSPALSVSTGTLSGFSYTAGSGPSANQTYTVTGTNLSPSSGSITTQCLTDYEVSTNGSTFSSSVSLSYTGTALSTTTIYVRLKAGLSAGNFNSETVSNAGGGATSQNVSCSGIVNVVSTALFTDDMNYTVGTLLSANGWTAHSGAGTNPPTITAPGLTYSNYAGSGVGNAVTLSGNGEDDNHSFTSISSGSIYASAMINVTSANATGDYFFHFGSGSTTTYNARVYVKSTTGGFVFGVCKSATTANIQWSSKVLATGTNNFIVLKYTFVTGSTTNDKAELFINPAVGGSEPASDLSAVITDADFTSIDRLCFRQGSSTPVVTIDGIRIDQSWAGVTPAAVTSKTLTLTALVEAMYVSGGSAMTTTPSVTVELHDASTFAVVESKTATLSTSGVGTFNFTTAVNGTLYYLVVKSVNTLETWSASAVGFTGGALSYDFTTGTDKAYTDGSNPSLATHGSKYCIYSGDVNQDGQVTSDDFTGVDNDNTNFDYHVANDVNGDGQVTSDDFTFIDNNNTNFVARQVPPGAPGVAKRVVRDNNSAQKNSVVK
ncbi:MAG: hypothetical protein P4L35_04010 [Ignavibacteriaceae bacterium]|nr:hypothetical protein [Ignavibacteriaceae bacterium]